MVKVGDTVICTDADHGLEQGREYRVATVEGNNLGVSGLYGGLPMFFRKRFALTLGEENRSRVDAGPRTL